MPRPTKEQWRAVRRAALAGELTRARSLLTAMAERSPEDEEVAAELSRLTQGLPLLCAATVKERKRLLEQKALADLTQAVSSYTPSSIAASSSAQLCALRATLRQCMRRLSGASFPIPHGVQAYKKCLERELARRRKRKIRSILVPLCLGGAVVALLGGAGWALYSRAASLTTLLRDALASRHWETTHTILNGLDTPIYRFIYPDANAQIAKAYAWQQSVISCSRDISHQLALYTKHASISTLSLEERANLVRRIRSLPETHARPFLLTWEELCRPEKAKLDQQRESIIEELRAAAKEPTLCGKPAEDAATLRKACRKLQTLIKRFSDAKDALDLPPDLISPHELLLSRLEAHLADAESLIRALGLMRQARTYKQHLKALQELSPRVYPAALAAAEAARTLPTEQEAADELRAALFHLPRHMPQEVIHAIVNKGPSFCAAYPASPRQLHLMEDIFTSRTLRQKVYEIFRATGEVHYADAPPTATKENTAIFTLSELDADRRADRSPRIEWPDAHSVWTREWDATPILRHTGISRETFFLKANLPEMLSILTSIREKNCPILARAYVFQTLLDVMELHDKRPDILGLRFSPTLRGDIESFRRVCEQSRWPLSVTCWLSKVPEAQEAEALFAKWFDEHANRDYNKEMSRALSRLLSARTRYLGHIDAQGEAHLHTPVDKGAQLWYYSHKNLISTPYGAPLQAPSPYSPIFSE